MSQEFAVFQDVDQFVPGRTQFACGFFATREVWASVPIGQKPTHTPRDITALALADYAKADGSNGPANEEGMSLQALYDNLKALGLPYKEVPIDSQAVSHIRGYLALKWPVVVALAESSVYDKALARCPYPWNPIYNHIIALTGQGPQTFEVWARDSANVDSRWVLRSGPRLYDLSAMRFVSITAVQMPYSETAPSESHPVAPTTVPLFQPDAEDLYDWHITGKAIPLIPEHAIPQAWLQAKRILQVTLGPVTSPERAVVTDGVVFMECWFSGGKASWNSKTNQVTFWTVRGPIIVQH